MDISGTRTIAAAKGTVWAHLNNPGTLRTCIPGCVSLEGSSEEGFEAIIKQKIGPVRATFKGRVSLSEIIEPTSYRISGEGSGGIAGFAKGDANVVLKDVSGGTELSFSADAQLGGKLAQLGSRLVGGVARRLTDDFFDAFQKHVEAAEASERTES